MSLARVEVTKSKGFKPFLRPPLIRQIPFISWSGLNSAPAGFQTNSRNMEPPFSVRQYDTDGAGTFATLLTFPTQTGKIVVEVYLMVDDIGGGDRYFALTSVAGNVTGWGPTIDFTAAGEIRANTSTGSILLPSFNALEWYLFTLLIDIPSNTWDVYINHEFRMNVTSFRNAVTSLLGADCWYNDANVLNGIGIYIDLFKLRVADW